MERLSAIPLVMLAAASAHAEELTLSTEHQDLRLVPVAEDLEQPWGVAILPGDLYVISERTGQIQTFYNGERQEVEGLPGIHVEGQAGLLDIAASPDYPDTGWIYFTYSSGDVDSTATALARGRLAGDRLVDVEELFEQNRRSEPSTYPGSRLAWMGDDTLLMSVGDRGTPGRAQDTQDHAGSILRLDPQGLAPEDNPLLEEAGYLPEIYSWGHRRVLGLAVDEKRSNVWAVESRSNGHDELLLLQRGRNHGWADEAEDSEVLVEDAGSGLFNEEDVVEPAYRFAEDVSPSGLAVVNGAHYPQWEGNLLVGGLESEQLYRFEVNGGEIAEREELLDEPQGPVREVRQGPDGYLYVLIGDEDGTLYRLEPEE
ncbi:PQQ-dependent sugar dehydrogenase [Halomonas sp. MCCC 1A17488]|uniref:PQQ-dependent sugar dehydrogenase n=1 Tax=Billgrantia sulfidoxydans TaxID=2733484 RepID=A0ABX7WBX1_9GAMM|nr:MULTISPECIES: PQQ-dependent sugar dehydrogenase [Halomonas]MCE8018470.1 PQQ-dependent sugar dehydrogenase [Halomonas sp. MCCC 1A17488]MCG3241803.1 PQQ-dependent sugar dehydrogenase [Halomonas sp. MCCC 1A17488]QPP49170.1 PQQ-dependent sugar dehydrogenase [Halomonas sp. SS10-MC5]QTP56504.1 PQQ-dependent sugar dehydrogenase [Halomonas sulfidoxydans]